MEIVIKIPEEVYKSIQDGDFYGISYMELHNGKPLPKGHGPIVDVEVLKAVLPIYVFRNEQGHFCKISDMDKIPPFAIVIEADKEVDE